MEAGPGRLTPTVPAAGAYTPGVGTVPAKSQCQDELHQHPFPLMGRGYSGHIAVLGSPGVGRTRASDWRGMWGFSASSDPNIRDPGRQKLPGVLEV